MGCRRRGVRNGVQKKGFDKWWCRRKGVTNWVQKKARVRANPGQG